MNNGSLSIIDDEPSVAGGIKRRMRNEGYIIYTANSGKVFDPGVLSVFLKIPGEEIDKINHTTEMSDGT